MTEKRTRSRNEVLAIAGQAAVDTDRAMGLLALVVVDMEKHEGSAELAQVEVWAGMLRFLLESVMEAVSPAAAAYNRMEPGR